MVVRIQLTVRHIRGHTFPIDADVESDVLGLKVQIWESQKIAIENQRLVFGGKELLDNLKLAELGIGDNAVIFLVESNSEIPAQPEAEANPIQSQVSAPPTTIQVPMSTCSYNNNNSSNKSQFLQPSAVYYYEPFEDDSVVSEERMQGVIALAFWVRLYCLFGMLITAISSFQCLYCLIPLLMYTLGFFGTRKLNRCLLIFPLLLTTILGFGLFGFSIFWLIYEFEACKFILLFIGFLHIIIFSCICKLMCRISKLTCQEWWQARLRIQSKCCCC